MAFDYSIMHLKRLFFCLLLLGPAYCGRAQQDAYTFVFLTKNANADKISQTLLDSLMKGHMANINRLAAEGKLIAAGPFDGGGGIFILRTASTDQAKDWLSTDPGIRARRWEVTLHPYKPLIGSVCAVKEPYEMVSYAFVRFDMVVTKFTAQSYPDILRRHEEFVKKLATTGNVVTYGILGEHDTGILVMKGEVQREVIEADPGIQEGLFEVQYKTLWIAKGSFCEPKE
ncbi:YciI family protein [Parachryseolinea silvisoli]|uniref:YciI family protein n=1 Tax=Parachryseolinea silvisoli TaxID=2873601 RepID=UPI002265C87E|nr:YciI family protein [Parachryseolinea silvisoli]MCD9016221.1 YciI family protein [Parachryseolinea silvisoli]